MALPRSLLQYICSLVLFIACANALKFDLQATSQSHDNKKERCIRNFVARDTLVVVTAIVSGAKGDGMRVNMHVSRSSCRRTLLSCLETETPALSWMNADSCWRRCTDP
jgi:hypothetical protein